MRQGLCWLELCCGIDTNKLTVAFRKLKKGDFMKELRVSRAEIAIMGLLLEPQGHVTLYKLFKCS